MPPRKKSKVEPLGIDAFLRSINIVLDIDDPSRIGHMRPTGKSIRYLRALLEDDGEAAWLIAAPYGTGKSLVTTFALHCVETTAKGHASIRAVVDRINELSPEFASVIKKRFRSRKCGIAVPLHGHHHSVAEGIQESVADALKRHGYGRQAAGVRRRSCSCIEDAISLLDEVASSEIIPGVDRIAIVWDEFGRHLETLASEGRAAELLDVQVLAEWASRATAAKVRFAVLLHQGVVNYAAGLPDVAKREWAKIEGRFARLEFIDDSIELMRLVAELASSRRSTNVKPPTQKSLKALAGSLRDSGALVDVPIKDAVELARVAYPLTLPSLLLLPRVASRVAQNERTIFSFVQAMGLEEPIDPSVIYQYFSPAMRADIAPGGTYRQWIETESAVAKVESETEMRVLQTCSLLGLGFTGNRSRVSKSMLLAAASTIQSAESSSAIAEVVDSLIDAKLLLHRRHSDEVSIWHGTDADLRSRQADLRETANDEFDVVAFLTSEFPPAPLTPTAFNDQRQMRRYFDSRYIGTADLNNQDLYCPPFLDIPLADDGRVFYIVPTTSQDLEAAEALARGTDDPCAVFALPTQVLSVRDAAVDLWAILSMQHDQSLIESDPLVADELRVMEDDARGHLVDVLERSYEPSRGLRWFHRGTEVILQSNADLRGWLSAICESVYCDTPIINNEVTNRKKPSPVIVNARKKLIESVLEADGVPNLGFGAGGKIEVGAAVEAIYRATLQSTGIYGCDDDDRWWFRHPKDIPNAGLSRVWECFRAFLTEYADQPKCFSALLRELQQPPYGLRAGVIPILMASAFRAFHNATVLTCDGEYVDDIAPSTIESICKEPTRFKLRVVELKPAEEAFIDGIYELFMPSASYKIDEPDCVRRCVESIEAWVHQLANASKKSRRLSSVAMNVRGLLLRKKDPVNLLVSDLPKVLSGKITPRGLPALLKKLAAAKDEIENVTAAYLEDAKALFLHCANVPDASPDEQFSDIARRWAEAFPMEYVRTLESPAATALVATASADHDDSDKAMNAMSVALYGRAINRWDDADVKEFAAAIKAVTRDLEDGVVIAVEGGQLSPVASRHVAAMLESRIGRIAAALQRCDPDSEIARVILTATPAESELFHDNA